MHELFFFFFFFNDTATTEIYTLSLHDALPIFTHRTSAIVVVHYAGVGCDMETILAIAARQDRKSTRLNSSHQIISYAVFCLKKKKTTDYSHQNRTTKRTTTRASC